MIFNTFSVLARKRPQLVNALALLFLLGMATCEFTNPGCAQFDQDNQCVGCIERHFLELGVCYPVSPLCLTYNPQSGACLTCYDNYDLNNGMCMRKPIANCSSYTPLGDCRQCEDRFFLAKGKCSQISKGCKDYLQDGTCTSCLEGYLLQSGHCFGKIDYCLSQLGEQCKQCKQNYIQFNNLCHEKVQNCRQYVDGACSQCDGELILVDQLCLPPVQNCTEYNLSTGDCLTCQTYFQVFEGECMPILDQFCSVFNGTICLQCSQNYYFSAEGRCLQVDPLCKTHNDQGHCLSCFNGYSLSNGACKQAPEEMDPYCSHFNGTRCTRCSWGYRFNSEQVCVELDYLCRLYNPASYQCEQCYPGFMVGQEQRCVPITEPGCLVWFRQGCQSCHSGYYLLSGRCQAIDPLCSNFNLTTLECKSCYAGYYLSDNKCREITSENYLSNCKEHTALGQCLSCYWGSYISGGKCVEADPLCRTFDQKDGRCTSCYGGYFLMRRAGKCVPLQ